ncbi:MAG TPA: RIP metalloprotease RseP, partial [Blastocatellia bacterium]|nr:RIP metalloprotease RseP [Blastocatellia bacterium]
MGIVAFIIILCAMIVIHEFGHFIVAKMLGIAVETFSVGFGPRLFGFRIGDTDYRFSAIPLGGYVKFRGENLELLQGKSEGSIDEFLSHPKWKRLLVAVAGPVFNIITALLIPTAAIMIGFQDDIYNSQQVVIGEVTPGSTAEQSGLQKGDRIIAFADKKNPTWAYWRDRVITNLGEDIPLTVDRNGQIINLKLRPRVETRGKEQVGVVDLEPHLSYIGVARVEKNSPADLAGLKVGDKISAINGAPVTGWHQFRRVIQEGHEVTLNVQRGQETLTIKGEPQKRGEQYVLGFDRVFETKLMKTDSFASALRYGWDSNIRVLRFTGEIFQQIFSGRRSMRDSLS